MQCRQLLRLRLCIRVQSDNRDLQGMSDEQPPNMREGGREGGQEDAICQRWSPP